MANCSEKPEVSLMPLNEDMIRVERMVGCNIMLPEYILSEHIPDTSDANMLMQHTPNVHTLSSQIFEALPLDSECTNVANNCDCVPARVGSQYPNSVIQHEVTHKNSLGTAMEQSSDFNESAEIKTIFNGSNANSSVPVDSSTLVSVLGTERSNVSSSISSTSSNICLGKSPEGTVVSVNPRASIVQSTDEFVQTKGTELNSTSGNKTFKSGELINQLIEGPCIMLPPSQLPVIPSYSSSLPQNQRQSVCSSSGISGVQQNTHHTDHLTYAEALTQNQHSSGHIAVQNDGSVPKDLSTAENVPLHASNSTQRESTAKDVSETSSEQTASTLTAGDAAKAKAKRTPNDFVFGKVIGEGSYSTVYLAKEVSTQREFAIKVCDKKHLIRERKTHFVMREKEVLMKLDHPFFIKLAYTFQDSERLYYVLTYARNGELLGYLHKLSAFDVPCTRFYSAEIVLALEYLHGLGIIHRDLKPENILISEDMHIRITDFGTSKILSQDSEGKADNKADVKRKNSFVGTAEYVSPEVLNNQPANFGSDLWALGCIIYQCLSGSLPFRSGNEYQTFQKIVKAEFDFPEGFHPDAKDLVQKLLVIDPAARLGMTKPEGMTALKNHNFFEEIDWETLPEATAPKLMPYLPATANNPEFWGQEQRTGFDDQRLAEIITGQSADGSMSPELEELPIKMLSQAEDTEKAEKLRKQKAENAFHQFVQNNLIIKQGFVDKRKGLFARKRMLLLTEGPHLYYVDAHNKVLKGEIPWSKYLRPEAKNFKIFFVHTPNRTYYLESRQPDAQDWVKQIREVWKKYYDNGKEKK